MASRLRDVPPLPRAGEGWGGGHVATRSNSAALSRLLWERRKSRCSAPPSPGVASAAQASRLPPLPQCGMASRLRVVLPLPRAGEGWGEGRVAIGSNSAAVSRLLWERRKSRCSVPPSPGVASAAKASRLAPLPQCGMASRRRDILTLPRAGEGWGEGRVAIGSNSAAVSRLLWERRKSRCPAPPSPGIASAAKASRLPPLPQCGMASRRRDVPPLPLAEEGNNTRDLSSVAAHA